MEKKQPLWAFLDEINTCQEMGMVNDIICHRSIDGRPLTEGVIPLAACNPYRVKNCRMKQTAGFHLRQEPEITTELVYSVNPLPESMMAFVWEYGELTDTEEEKYLMAMLIHSTEDDLEDWRGLVVELVMFSQVWHVLLLFVLKLSVLQEMIFS